MTIEWGAAPTEQERESERESVIWARFWLGFKSWLLAGEAPFRLDFWKNA